MLLKSGKGPPAPVLAAATQIALRALADRPTGRLAAQPNGLHSGPGWQAARAAGRLTGVSASADFCALPRIHEA